MEADFVFLASRIFEHTGYFSDFASEGLLSTIWRGHTTSCICISITYDRKLNGVIVTCTTNSTCILVL